MNERAATRVVVLARPGEARTRLDAALCDAGADVALVADPAETDPAEVSALHPQVILVSLEPAVEEALERYEALFSEPSITVLFDEADLAARREGWEAARWARHLAAKLNRHDDVLPPGGEMETDWPSPGPLPPRAELGELDITALAGEALELAAGVPRDDDYLRADDSRREDPVKPADVAATAGDPGCPDPTDAGPATVNAGAFDGTLALVDADTATPAATPTKGSAETGPAVTTGLFDNLSLVDDGGQDEPASVQGAVVVEGGIGAPDAVRQLLAALPVAFPRPVLVRLQLDGGRYDRLVKQMARVSSMPVTLAEAGQAAAAGTVYFLEPGTTLLRENGRLVFAASDVPVPSLHARLPANDSATLLLSGSDVSLVDAALAQGREGALVAAQSVDDCYEPTASAALIERGGESGTLTDLADRLAARWPSPDQVRDPH